MSGEGRIDLAREGDLRIGDLVAHPALRQLVRDDGAEEVLEPRVMQVLIALAQAKGGILTRDQLTERCWEGRVVGEDAINRVISRLRRAAEGIGRGSFRIETLTKVGYRLVEGEGASAASARSIGRRALLASGGALGAVVLAGGGYWLWRGSAGSGEPPPEVAALMVQARAATTQGTVDGHTQAIGLLRRVTQLRPDYADGWGMLALSYGAGAVGRARQFETALRARAHEAIRRARAIDPDNAYALAAEAFLLPSMGNWHRVELALRTGLARHPDSGLLLGSLAAVLLSVGRCREAAELNERAYSQARGEALYPGPAYSRVQALWAAGRLDEADRAMAEAAELFPTHFAVWFTRFHLLLYTGRAEEAIGLAENAEGRPTGIPEWNFEQILVVARAMRSRARADIDAAEAWSIEGARKGAGYAENAIQFLSALGRLDAAFAVSDAYYFARGFDPGELRFSVEQRTYTRRNARRTHLLFLPSTASMRAEPRFAPLVRELGLDRYWREAGVTPDYRKA